jgi:hypothetical protein
MALSNMAQFDMGGKEEVEVVAAYADALWHALRGKEWSSTAATQAVNGALPAIVAAVSGRGR